MLHPGAFHGTQYNNAMTVRARADNHLSILDNIDVVLDLIDAQRTLLEFELSYERALADRTTMLAQLETIVGQELQHNQNEGSAP